MTNWEYPALKKGWIIVGKDIENFEILGNELDENYNCLENFLLLEITINIIQNWKWNKTDSEMN